MVTVTTTEEVIVPQAVVTVTVYVPAPKAVMPVMLGFCELEVKPLGPVHE